MWVLVGLIVGLIAVVVGISVVLVYRRRTPPEQRVPELTGDQFFTLGIIFTGAGVAMTVTIGPFMVWMIALGIIYMAMGAQMKRTPPE